MKQPVVLLICLSAFGVSGKVVDHAELRGELSDQEDIDNGQCVPMPCVMGVPTSECKKLCDLRHYETICQPPADFCLCRHMVHGKMKLVSPDEVLDQLPDSSEDVDRSEKSKVIKKPPVSSKVVPSEETPKTEPPVSSKVVPSEETPKTNTDDELVSFQIYYEVLLPIKQYLYESWNEEDSALKPTADTASLGYEPVNVHEGRLFWDFRYILTGLLFLMISLVVYELMVCAWQVYRSKPDTSVKCEVPSVVQVIPAYPEKEKILQV